VGPKTRALLLRELGSVAAIEQASVERMVEVGTTRKQAEAVYAHLHAHEEPTPAVAEGAEELAVDHAFEGNDALNASGDP
jgi:ERCC4-type nuclease